MKISIVTPTYNSEYYIEETIESIITQKGNFEIEYLIIDGGSTDNTLKILDNYKNLLNSTKFHKKCKNITFDYISEPDNGMYDAIAKGFQKINGDVVAYLNSDDYYLPNAFQAIYLMFTHYKTLDWLTGVITVYNKYGNIVKLNTPYFYSRTFIKKGIYGKYLPFIQQESCFWRKGLLDKINLNKFASYKYAGDYYLWHEFSKYANLEILNTPLSGFRTHAGNKSQNIKAYFEEFDSIKSMETTLMDKIRIWYQEKMWKMTDIEKRKKTRKIFALFNDALVKEIETKSLLQEEKELIQKKDSSKSLKQKYKKQISIVIGSFNRINMLKLCIDAVREELKDFSYEIIVVDGGSTDGTIEWLVSQKDIISIIQHNRGEWNGKPIERRSWGYFMNLGFKSAQGKYICMLSDDSLIVPGAIKNGYSLFEEKLNKGDKIGGVAFYFRDYPIRKKYAVAVNVGNLYVNHGLFLNQALKDVNYISEDEYHFYFADTDLALKIKEKGYDIVASSTSFVEHYFEATPEIRASNNDDKKEKDRLWLIEKWAGKAYSIEDKEKYKKTVGYWDFFEGDYIDKTNRIDLLMRSSENV